MDGHQILDQIDFEVHPFVIVRGMDAENQFELTWDTPKKNVLEEELPPPDSNGDEMKPHVDPSNMGTLTPRRSVEEIK